MAALGSGSPSATKLIGHIRNSFECIKVIRGYAGSAETSKLRSLLSNENRDPAT